MEWYHFMFYHCRTYNWSIYLLGGFLLCTCLYCKQPSCCGKKWLFMYCCKLSKMNGVSDFTDEAIWCDSGFMIKFTLPDVVILAEDHASFAVAGATILAQLSMAAWTLEAPCVPVALHGEEQEAVCDSTSTSGTWPGHGTPATTHHCHCRHLHPVVHHNHLKTGTCYEGFNVNTSI